MLVLIMGCSTGIKIQGDKVVVEKRIGQNEEYELYKEIEDGNEVKNIKNIIESITWEDAKVCMTHPADYTFYFENTKVENKAEKMSYGLWVSPSKEKIDIVIYGESKYSQLNKEKSEKLFEMLTGKKLDNN